MRILLVKPTALGDVAQALCVAPLLKQWPGQQVHLTWLVDEDYAPLVRLSPWVDELILFPRRRLKQAGLRAFFGWLRTLRDHDYDLVLDLQGLARSALMTRAVHATRRVGLRSGRECSRLAYNECVDDRQVHAVDRYLAAVHYVTQTSVQRTAMTLQVPPREQLPVDLLLSDYVVLHPYSLWTTKLWPWQNYDLLARQLPTVSFVMVGQGPFFPVLAPNILDLRNRTNLMELLAVLGHAQAVLSTDSGPLHLAAALDRPLLALFGATDPLKTGPRASRVQCLTTNLECRPCLRRHCRYSEEMACMKRISLNKTIECLRYLINIR